MNPKEFDARAFHVYEIENLENAFKKIKETKPDALMATIHHAAFSRGRTSDPQAIVDMLYKWHVEEKKWKAPGYDMVLLHNLKAIMLPRAIYGMSGAHALGKNSLGERYNDISLGIVIWDDLNDNKLHTGHEAMVRMSKKYLQFINQIPSFKRHNELNNTSCPGKNFPKKLW